MKRRTLFLVVGILLVVAVGLGIAFFTLLVNHPFKSANMIYIDTDDTVDSVYVKLEKELHASTLTGFRCLVSLKGYMVHSGAYRIDSTFSVWDAYHKLAKGQQTPVNLVIPSVRTLGQLARTVSRQIMSDSASIATLLSDSTYCASLGYTKETLPALFIPNTYQVYWSISSRDFVKRMQKEYARFWNETRKEKARKIGLTPIEVSTLASIVEEETANKAEKPVVAGLYLNRLHAGMPLQADPTIKFALQGFGLRRILHKHLEVESPYNTYKYLGLPPGPIRIPSIDGLESVLNYTVHNYLYMCAKEDFSGTHNFAETFSKHLINARRYQAALNRLQHKP